MSWSRADRRWLLTLFFGALSVFLLAPVRQGSADMEYQLVASTALLRDRSLVVTKYVASEDEARTHLWRSPSGIYQYFPPGTSVLSTPAIVVGELLGVETIDARGRRDAVAEAKIGAALAAVLMATFVALVFATARLLLDRRSALAIACVTALGSAVLSTLSRGLWSQTWAVLLVGIAWYLVLGDATGRRALSPIVLGTLLAWAWFTRPTMVISACAIVAAVFASPRRRSRALVAAAVAAAWTVGFIAWSRHAHGTWLPPYYHTDRLDSPNVLVGFAGILVSPSRGLFVYSPVLLLVFVLALRSVRTLSPRRVALAALVACAAHVLLVATFRHWEGGASYGPRLLADLLPSAVVLAVIVAESVGFPRRATAALAALSIAMHLPGALFAETWEWCYRELRVERRDLWSITRAQVLAPLRFDIHVPPPDDADTLGGSLALDDPLSDRFVVAGFDPPEPGFRWTRMRHASIAFRLPETALVDSKLTLHFSTFLAPPREPAQRLIVRLNGATVVDELVTDGRLRAISTPIAASQLSRDVNDLVFELPDARSPAELGMGKDPRRLGIALHAIELFPIAGARRP